MILTNRSEQGVGWVKKSDINSYLGAIGLSKSLFDDLGNGGSFLQASMEKSMMDDDLPPVRFFVEVPIAVGAQFRDVDNMSCDGMKMLLDGEPVDYNEDLETKVLLEVVSSDFVLSGGD